MIGPMGFIAGPRPAHAPEPSRDPCEWDPSINGPLAHENAHASAAVVLGRGTWRLCTSCAALHRFKRYKIRRPIRAVEP